MASENNQDSAIEGRHHSGDTALPDGSSAVASRDERSFPKHLEHLPTDQLQPNPRNARTHSRKQINQIAESIQQFGFTNPVLVDEQNGVIAGHGRVQAAKQLGLADVPVVRLSHLSDAAKRAYILADNKIGRNAG